MLAGLIGWTLAWSGRRTPAFHATTWYNAKNWPYRRRKREIKWNVNSGEERRIKEKDKREKGDWERERGSEREKKKLRKMEVRVEERGRKRKKKNEIQKKPSFERKREKGETGNSCAKSYLYLSSSSSLLATFPLLYSSFFPPLLFSSHSLFLLHSVSFRSSDFLYIPRTRVFRLKILK